MASTSSRRAPTTRCGSPSSRREAPRPDQQPIVNDEVRAALGGGDTGAPALISLGLVPALKVPEAFEEVLPPTPIPVQWEITTRGRTRLRNRLPHAGAVARRRRDPRPDPPGRAAPVAAGRVAHLGALERRRRESRRRCRRCAAADRRRRTGGTVDRLAPDPAARRPAGRSAAADLGRHQRRGHRPAHDAGRPRAGRLDRRSRSGLPAAARLGRCGHAAGAGRGAGPRLPAVDPG